MSIGVIGGLGPMATVVYMKKVVSMTDASRDQDHPDMIVFSSPSVPDRTAYILGESSDSPLPAMLEMASKLDAAGVDVIAVPCITARYFNSEIGGSVGIPVIHGVEGTASYLKRNGYARVGIMATSGSIRSGVIASVLESYGIEAVIPDDEGQKTVTSLIYDSVKCGKPADMDALHKVRDELMSRGAQICLLGCTELSVISDSCDIGDGFFDILDMLAAQSVVMGGGRLREEYQYLVE